MSHRKRGFRGFRGIAVMAHKRGGLRLMLIKAIEEVVTKILDPTLLLMLDKEGSLMFKLGLLSFWYFW
jgi:hypothetical protein